VFAVGHLSWEWRHSLRSVIHPLFIAVAYYLLHFFDVDSNFAVIFVPRLIHVVLFAISDRCFLEMAKHVLSPLEARYALFSYGIPSVLTVQLIPIVGGVVMALRWRGVTLVPLVISLFYIIFHSFLAHKEHRFLLPVIPLLSIYAGYFFVIRCVLIILLLLVNIPLAVYTGLYHQIGPFTASDFIAKHAMITFGKNKHFSVLQLMPCYSMPQYSHMHGLNCTLRALDCSPNLGNIGDFIDESDMFHSNPLAFIKCSRLFHAHFLTSDRQDSYIVVVCRNQTDWINT
uniref:Mannosyltransferase n=1 Tax=Parascaris equorum TaxID=6256 RepID=A0A914RED3_PAREQ